MMFSVIIPVYNNNEGLKRCLRALVNQSRPADEIIVVDNGSKMYIDIPYRNIIYVYRNLKKSSYYARNEGIKLAKGDWYIFIDSDCEPDVNFIKHYEEAVNNIKDYKVFCGRYTQVCKNKEFERILNNEIKQGPTTGNVCVHKSLFETRQFNEDEPTMSDMDFFKGVAYFRINGAEVKHYQTFLGHFKRVFRYGTGYGRRYGGGYKEVLVIPLIILRDVSDLLISLVLYYKVNYGSIYRALCPIVYNIGRVLRVKVR